MKERGYKAKRPPPIRIPVNTPTDEPVEEEDPLEPVEKQTPVPMDWSEKERHRERTQTVPNIRNLMRQLRNEYSTRGCSSSGILTLLDVEEKERQTQTLCVFGQARRRVRKSPLPQRTDGDGTPHKDRPQTAALKADKLDHDIGLQYPQNEVGEPEDCN